MNRLSAGVFLMSLAGAEAFAQDIGLTVGVDEFVLSGVTAYDPGELLLYSYQIAVETNGTASADGIAEAVEQIYLEDGYFLAEVFPGADGRSLRVDEGFIREVSIEGVDAREFALVRSYVAPVVGVRPLRLPEFERAVMLSDDLTGIAVHSELDYPDELPGARLRLIGEPLASQSGALTVDHPPRQLGETVTATFEQEFYNALSAGDLFRFSASLEAEDTEGDDYSLFGALAYRLPFTGTGLFAEGYVGNVVGRRAADGSFLETDLEGDTAILALGYPVLRRLHSYAYLLGELRASRVESEAGGETLESEADVVSLGAFYGHSFGSGAVFEGGIELSFGRQGADTDGFDDGDEDFRFVRAGFDYEAPFPGSPNSHWRAELFGQVSSDRLPALEEFYLGEREALRGYIFDEAQGDTGLVAQFEVTHDIFPDSDVVRRIRPFAYFDWGAIENNAPGASEADWVDLASAGIGLDAELGQRVFLRSHLGVPLRDGPVTGRGDPALYLGVTTSW